MVQNFQIFLCASAICQQAKTDPYSIKDGKLRSDVEASAWSRSRMFRTRICAIPNTVWRFCHLHPSFQYLSSCTTQHTLREVKKAQRRMRRQWLIAWCHWEVRKSIADTDDRYILNKLKSVNKVELSFFIDLEVSLASFRTNFCQAATVLL
jgi:hypothetical protein